MSGTDDHSGKDTPQRFNKVTLLHRVAIVGFVIGNTAASIIAVLQPSGWSLALGLGVYVIAAVVPMALIIFSARRLKRSVMETRGCLCVQCLYDLRTLPAPGTCPECATPFPADRNISHWINADMIMRFETREPPSTSSAPDTHDAGPPPENR